MNEQSLLVEEALILERMFIRMNCNGYLIRGVSIVNMNKINRRRPLHVCLVWVSRLQNVVRYIVLLN